MNTQHRRFVFIDFENLKKIKFKKLEKVATRIFIFIHSEVESIPSNLVFQVQKLGKDIRWIVVPNVSGQKMNYHMAFLMGKLHQKLHLDVEFAVLSNDKEFDPLVNFINSQNRSCLRVKRKKTVEEKLQENRKKKSSSTNTNGNIPIEDSTSPFNFPMSEEVQPSSSSLIEKEYDRMVIEKTAEETLERLLRSGNRPAEIATLKHYILLHNQELSLHGNLDQIIQKMEESKDIEIDEGAVIYNF